MNQRFRNLDLPGLILIAGAGVVYSIRSVWTPYQTGIVIVGLAAVALSLVARRKRILAGLTGRQGRYGANSLISVVLLIGVLGFVNYLGLRNDRRLDLTSEGFNSLAEQSLTVTDQLTQDVHIRAFYPGGDDASVRQLLNLYTNRSSGITYELIDPDGQPQLAEQYEVTVYGFTGNPLTGQSIGFGTLILEMGEFVERVESQEALNEEDVTNALMKLAKGERKTIYFIEGHGEKPIDSGRQGGMDDARAGLEREGYVVDRINLIVDEVIPEDASVLVWPGPENEPFDEEVEIVDRYLNQGGSVLVMIDPIPSASLEALLDRWSVSTGNDFIVDASGMGRLLGAGPEIPLVLDYGIHAITEGLDGVMTFFPLARSVTPNSVPGDEVASTYLLRSSDRSWGETDFENSQASMDEDVDLPGPVGLGVVATRDLDTEPGDDAMARLVVVGDSEFASNGYFTQQGNGNLFLNIVNWLAEDESFISIRPTLPENRPLTLTASGSRVSLYLSMVLLPMTIVAIGISVWMRRRKQ